MEGARSILLSITGGNDISLWEVNEAAKAVAEAAHPDANIIFGAMVDEKLDDQVWVTVVATGFGDRPRRRREEESFGSRLRPEAEPAPWVPGAGRGAAREPDARAAPRASSTSRSSCPVARRGRAAPGGRELERRRAVAPACCVSATLIGERRGSHELGVVAAGHPLSARPPEPRCSGRGATPSTPRWGRCWPRSRASRCSPGWAPGGYMLVVAPGPDAGAARLLRRGAGAGDRYRAAGAACCRSRSRSATPTRCSTSGWPRWAATGSRPGSPRPRGGSAAFRWSSSPRRRRRWPGAGSRSRPSRTTSSSCWAGSSPRPPEASALFAPQGTLLRTGERIYQPELAEAHRAAGPRRGAAVL